MSNNMFTAAKEKQPAKTTGKGKATKPQFDVESLHQYAALKNAAKQIDTALETLKEEVNEQAFDIFLNSQSKDSFQGIEGDTSASLQLRKRTSRSLLTEAEQALLESHDISMKKTEDSRFYIARDYSDNAELLEKVSAALEGIVPEDFFGHTGDKYVVGDDAINEALRIEDEDNRRDVTKVVSTQAARCNFGGSNQEALDILREVIYPKPKSA